jgi:hypothetical protein
VIQTDRPGAFLSSRPEWTIQGACINAADKTELHVTQGTFFWFEGAWQADVTVLAKGSEEGTEPLRLVLRISPDTLRRWREVSINPFVEACAQLRDHIRSARHGHVGTLTLL